MYQMGEIISLLAYLAIFPLTIMEIAAAHIAYAFCRVPFQILENKLNQRYMVKRLIVFGFSIIWPFFIFLVIRPFIKEMLEADLWEWVKTNFDQLVLLGIFISLVFLGLWSLSCFRYSFFSKKPPLDE